METEIKLLLPAGARAAVEADAALAGAEAATTHNVSTYFDTPDFALRARGAVLRVRETPEGRIQTVKGPSGSDGFASRGEWEWPAQGDAVDRTAIGREPAALRLVGADLDRLAPVFVTDIRRTSRRLVVEAGSEVEVAVDEGEARAGERRAGISELELELKAGPPGPLYRLAAELARRHGLRYGAASKSERGYALLTDALPPHPGAADLVLDPAVTLAEAVPLMVAAAARDLAVDLAGAARGDVEGVHRMRAAIRKLRTLLVLFGPHLDRAAARRFNDELRSLGRALGRGRDWDVFLTETLPEAEAEGGAVSVLRERAAARSRSVHAEVADVLAGPLPTDLLLGLSLWTAGRGWLRDLDDPAADAPLHDRLPHLLDRLEHRVARRGRRIRSHDGKALHDLRKAMKKLRYASEDVASLYRRKTVAAYVGRIRKVLADLGRINDSAETEVRLTELAAADEATIAAAADALRVWTAARCDRARRDLHRRWRKFRRADPFWA